MVRQIGDYVEWGFVYAPARVPLDVNIVQKSLSSLLYLRLQILKLLAGLCKKSSQDDHFIFFLETKRMDKVRELLSNLQAVLGIFCVFFYIFSVTIDFLLGSREFREHSVKIPLDLSHGLADALPREIE